MHLQLFWNISVSYDVSEKSSFDKVIEYGTNAIHVTLIIMATNYMYDNELQYDDLRLSNGNNWVWN